MENSWIEELRLYLHKEDKVKLKQDWAEIEALNLQGPNALEYSQYLSEYYLTGVCAWRFEEIEVKSNMTPDFSGSFFYCNIVA